MPNYAMNELDVEAPNPKALQDFIFKMAGACQDEEVLSFQSIMPMPEILEGTISPTMTHEKVLSLIEKNVGEKMSIEDFEAKYKSHPIRNNIEEYRHNELAYQETGFYNWYDWQYDNWGVKWGASESSLNHYEENKCSYNYQTPWGTAQGWLNFLARTYPDFKFHNKCADPSMNFHTELIFEDGELLEEINIEFTQALEQGEWGGFEAWEEFSDD